MMCYECGEDVKRLEGEVRVKECEKKGRKRMR